MSRSATAQSRFTAIETQMLGRNGRLVTRRKEYPDGVSLAEYREIASAHLQGNPGKAARVLGTFLEPT